MTGSVESGAAATVEVTSGSVVVVGTTAADAPPPADDATDVDVADGEPDRATVVTLADGEPGTGPAVVPPDCVTTVVVVAVPVAVVVGAGAAVVVVATDVLIVICVAAAFTDGPVLELPSTTVFERSSSSTVPSELHVTDTVMEVEVDAADGVTVHPVAVPSTRKSPDTIPETASENVSV
jgi:hypothetical protein